MYSVEKTFEIAAAHSLTLSYQSKCENLHGHNWQITVRCEAKELNQDGMVVDFSEIKERIHSKLDHSNLNDRLSFNPTAENIARWIVETVPYAVWCRVQESQGNVAEYCKTVPPREKKYKIAEIFSSIQGEGRFVGQSVVFVRFAGCNYSCPFCDTNTDLFQQFSIDEILTSIESYNLQHIVLTGGEPGLQVDRRLIDSLHDRGFLVHIETNGSIRLPIGIDWVTLSPKIPPGMTVESMLRQDKKLECKVQPDEIKIVWQGRDFMSLVPQVPCKEWYIQPQWDKHDEQLLEIIDFIRQEDKWKLGVQLHKMLGLQ